MNEFPSTIKQLLSGNGLTYKTKAIIPEYSFLENRKGLSEESFLTIQIIVEDEDLIIFENFYHVSIGQGNIPFTADFYLGIQDTRNVFVFAGGYQATHLRLGRYSITFQVKAIQ